MANSRNKLTTVLSIAAIIGLLAFSVWAEHGLDAFIIRILNMWSIYAIMVASFILIYGITGQFSLAHAGLAAIGAYTVSLLTLRPDAKQMSFLLSPPHPLIANVQWPLLPALILGGVLAALVGFAIGAPALRLHGDYLLIVTLGFSEIIRLVLVNMTGFTNGAMGLKGIPYLSNLTWSFGVAIIAILFVRQLTTSSYGRALMCIRDDEIAAEALGVNLFQHKTLAFVISSFFIGIAGGLYAEILGTVDPNTFRPALSYAVITMAILGGIRSLTGGIVAAGIYTIMSEVLRSVEAPQYIFNYYFPGLPGLRQLFFATMLLLLILYARKGIMGNKEFSWSWVVSLLQRKNAKRIEATGVTELNPAIQVSPPISEIKHQKETTDNRIILKVSDLTMRFGGLVAVSEFNLNLREGMIAGLIGPNGSGKTTVFNVVTGFYKPTHGHIFLGKSEITGLTPDKIAKMGLVRIFQNSRVFRELTVLDNVMIGYHMHIPTDPISSAIRIPTYTKYDKNAREKALWLLEQLGLIKYVNDTAGSLPYGFQRKLEVARALATYPTLLLLDEPATGLTVEEKEELIDFILQIRDKFNLTIWLIEHHMRVVMGICEEITVLNYGKTIARGTPEEIQSNPAVIQAYLGEG